MHLSIYSRVPQTRAGKVQTEHSGQVHVQSRGHFSACLFEIFLQAEINTSNVGTIITI